MRKKIEATWKARLGSAIFRVLPQITLAGAQDRGSAFQSDRLDFETRVVLQFCNLVRIYENL